MAIPIICIILKAVLFMQRGVSPWWTAVPFYNKVIIGKLCDNIKLGIIAAIFNFTTYLSFFILYFIEIMMVNKLPANIDFNKAKPQDYIPETLSQGNEIALIALAISSILFMIVWALLMREFSKKNNSNSWWMIGWVLCPIICYIYFIIIKKEYYTADKELVTFEKKVKVIKKSKDE